MSLTVCTPTIGERAGLLAECVASIQAQEGHGLQLDHLVELDADRSGPAVVRNRMATRAGGEWLAFVDDDDLWSPHHAATVEPLLKPGVDVVFTLAAITGRPGWDPQLDRFDPVALRRENYIPLCGVVFRAEAFHQVGGFPVEGGCYEDHELFVKLLDAGARWECIPERTWTYRFGDWDCRSREVWDGRRVC